jgi:carboxylesterase
MSAMVDVLPGCEATSYPGNRLGVLVLHGFTGEPSSMRHLAERIAAEGWSVELPRLPGHGTSVEDMMTTTWDDWSGEALRVYDDLATRTDKIAIVGLSMGGALTAFTAARRPTVGQVFMNALVKPVPHELSVGLQALLDAGETVIPSIGSDIKNPDVTEKAYEATPLACAASLFGALEDVRAGLKKISSPSLVLVSREDHTVTTDNAETIVDEIAGGADIIWYENSYHVLTLDNDAPAAEEATLSFLRRVLVG